MVKIGVLISGGGSNLQSIIDSIDKGNIRGQIEVVISNRRKAYGLKRAEKAGIETLYVNGGDYNSKEDFNRRIIDELSNRNIELVVLAGYLSILSGDFIKKFKGRIMNIHPSLIPSFCGRGCYGDRVHRMVLDRGVKFTGATVHFVDEGTDTGPIILQEIVRLEEDDTVETLRNRVLKLEHRLLPEAIKLYCRGRLHIEGNRVIIR